MAQHALDSNVAGEGLVAHATSGGLHGGGAWLGLVLVRGLIAAADHAPLIASVSYLATHVVGRACVLPNDHAGFGFSAHVQKSSANL